KRETMAPRLSDCCDVRFPDAIERVIRRGLERDPLLRQQTPVAFGDQLGRAVWGDERGAVTTSSTFSIRPSRSTQTVLEAPPRPTRSWVPPAALLVGACAGLLIGGVALPRSEASAEVPAKV